MNRSAALSGLKWISLIPGCGYGDAACEYLAGLHQLNYPVSWRPVRDDSDQLLDKRLALRDVPPEISSEMELLWDREGKWDSFLLHVPPWRWHHYWLETEPKLKAFCYLAWEVETLPDTWAPVLNPYSGVFVPSEFNRRALLGGGVTAPIHVLPHVARTPGPGTTAVDWGNVREDDFVFYTLGAWTTRKAMRDTVTAFLDAFNGDDPVALVVKTEAIDRIALNALPENDRDSIPPHHYSTAWALATLLAGRSNPPRVHLINDALSVDQIDHIHRRANCFISLAHSEGWGLGTFDAVLAGNPAVVTGWGGSLDYLGEDYPWLVHYRLSATDNYPDDGYFMHSSDAHWAQADLHHAAELMRSIFADADRYTRVATELGNELQKQYAARRVCTKLAGLCGLEPLS